MTQGELARKAGVTQAHISYWLNGERKPAWDKCKRLAEILGVDVVTIMDGNREDLKKLILEK